MSQQSANPGTAVCVCVALLLASASGQEPAEDRPEMALPPVSVRGVHVAPDLPSDLMRVKIHFNLRLGLGWPSVPGSVITPARVPQNPRNIAFTTAGIALRLDELVPGEPIRLRGLRALILRDRLPVANPFDGSIPGKELPRSGLARTEVVAGGATAWDGGAMGGAIHFLTQPPAGQLVTEKGNGRGRAVDGGPLKQRVAPTANLTAALGTHGVREAEWIFNQPTTRGILQLQGGIHAAGGFDVLEAAQRGAVDEPAWHRGRWLEARWRQPAGENRELTVSLRAYENSRGAGTPGQQRWEEGAAFTLAMAGGGTGGLTWNGALYLQNDDTEATLTSIDEGRLAETPVRRLAAMPATAIGASWTGAWWHFGDSRTIVGADLHHARGESREEFDFVNGAFQREAVAGGKQSRLGLSLLQQQPLGSAVRANFGARLELWNETSGRHREIDRVTGTTLDDERFPADRGAGFIPSAGVAWHINKAWRLRANGQSTRRRPTLAERYQTWGSQGVLTEGRPTLAAEKNTSFEAALEYGTAPGLTFRATAFRNQLRDLIGSRSMGGAPLVPGLAVRERINLDDATLQGVQFSAQRGPIGPFSLGVSLLFNDPRITSSTTMPGLVGKKLPHVPDRVATLSVGWAPTKSLRLTLGVRSTGRQFADEENTRRMPDAILTTFNASYQFSPKARFYLRAENVADARQETNRDPAGLRYLGSPRLIAGEVQLSW